jgi:predicted transcriptional regulator of viral defense system
MRKSLGKNGSKILNEMSRLGKEVFSISEAKEATKLENGILKETLFLLVKQGWLIRLEKGLYLIVPFEAGQEGRWTPEPFVLASKLISPYYISHWSAASFRGWTEQLPSTVFVSSPSRKFVNEKTILNITFRFVKISKDKFFGVCDEWVANKKIKFSDKEKTIVDILDKPALAGGIKEAAKCLRNAFNAKQLNPQILTDYISKTGNKAIFKRLGYICEVLGLFNQDWRNAWKGLISKGYSKLDPAFTKVQVKFNSAWQLIVNISDGELRKVIEE